MNAAIAQARATLSAFVEELASPRPAAAYSLKARFEEGGNVEHLWLDELRVADTGLEGSVANVPELVKGFDLGDRLRVSPEQVSDWLIVEKGRYRGGFTIRYFRSKMSEPERRAFDERMGALPD